MSNIYIQEPPTSGKVLLETTVGDIDLELWSKETPKACRNFIQLCKEGYYDGVIFHRVVPGFIVQGGDPTGTGEGGESVYGAPFKDEFHSRLRFTRRGLLAMANAGKNDNASQFFFTMAATPELQGKHTIFGKVAGDTLYNMLKLEQGELDDDRPLYPHKVLKTQVLYDPFDIIPREKEAPKVEEKGKKRSKAAAKNFKLLSFGDEAEEDEEDTKELAKQFAGKSKSSHDLANDPKLSSAPAVEPAAPARGKKRDSSTQETAEPADVDAVRNKLQKAPEPPKVDEYRLFQDDEEKKKAQIAATRNEFEQLKKDMQRKKQKQVEEEAKPVKKEPESEAIMEYKQQRAEFEERKKELPKRGASSREAQTMALLEKFKSKLQRVKEDADDAKPPDDAGGGNADEDDDLQKDESWMVHELHFTDNDPVLAKDANKKAEDWYDIYDPRNEMNKRRRENDAKLKKSIADKKGSSRL